MYIAKAMPTSLESSNPTAFNRHHNRLVYYYGMSRWARRRELVGSYQCIYNGLREIGGKPWRKPRGVGLRDLQLAELSHETANSSMFKNRVLVSLALAAGIFTAIMQHRIVLKV
jgi:hypothetical protein